MPLTLHPLAFSKRHWHPGVDSHREYWRCTTRLPLLHNTFDLELTLSGTQSVVHGTATATRELLLVRNYTEWMVQEQFGWQEFEDLCTAFIAHHDAYRDVRQAGRVGDQGRDAVIMVNNQEQVVFAYSQEDKPLTGTTSKFFRDYNRWRCKGLERFVFVSSRNLGSQKIDVPKALDDPPVTIYDITDLQRFLDYTPEGLAVKQRHGIDLPGAVATPAPDIEEVGPVSNRYTIFSLKDVSHAGAKRYTADILINGTTSKSTIRAIVAEAVGDLRSAELFRNPITRRYWEGLPTDVVFLFVYLSLDDVPNTNWICRGQWISPDLDQSARPLSFPGDETIEGITIDWNAAYTSRVQFFREHTVSLATYLAGVDRLMEELRPMMTTALELTQAYQAGSLTEPDYVEHMQALEPLVHELYRRSGNIGFAPAACHSLAQSFQQVVSAAHNVVLPFSERGLKRWPRRNRDYLVRSANDLYLTEHERMRVERQRLA